MRRKHQVSPEAILRGFIRHEPACRVLDLPGILLKVKAEVGEAIAGGVGVGDPEAPRTPKEREESQRRQAEHDV